jgi:hypothetical protein
MSATPTQFARKATGELMDRTVLQLTLRDQRVAVPPHVPSIHANRLLESGQGAGRKERAPPRCGVVPPTWADGIAAQAIAPGLFRRSTPPHARSRGRNATVRLKRRDARPPCHVNLFRRLGHHRKTAHSTFRSSEPLCVTATLCDRRQFAARPSPVDGADRQNAALSQD